jgi:fibronectin-binding autotransporter adhesin
MNRLVFAVLLIASISALGTCPRAQAAPIVSVSYVGPNYSDWSASTNWSPAVVPANSSSNSYSVTVSAPVTFDLIGSTAINDLLLSNTLNLNTGCNLAVTGQLALAGASLSGNGGSFSASGTASLSSSNLSAGNGSQMSFPTLTQITENDWPSTNTLQANNPGSLLDLSSVMTLSTSTEVFIRAGTGGKVSLPGLTQINDGGSFGSCSLNASGGTIDASGISVGGSNGGITLVQLSNAGTVLWGSPTTLNNFGLSISGPGNSIALSQVTAAANFAANATSGGLIAFPLLPQITENNWPNTDSLQASGVGSLLDLSHVMTISASTELFIDSGTGGKVSLPGLTQINNTGFGSCTLNASGGTIDVSGISASGNNGGVTSVQLSNSGTVLWGSPTILNNLSLSISGIGNSIALSQVTAAANFSANATNGGLIALPLLTQITENDFPSSNSLQASGTGSLLDLSHVTTISSSTSLSIQTGTGGKISLPNVTQINAAGPLGSCTVNASGGTIDVSSVGSGISSIQIGGGGVILLSGSASVSGGITLSGGSTSSTQGMLAMSGAIATLTLTDASATNTDLTIGGTSPGAAGVLDFRVGSSADRILLEAAKLVVNPGGGLIEITPEPGLAAGTYDLIDFGAGQASGLGGLTLATTAEAGYAFSLQNTPTSEQLVVAAAVPEPSSLALLLTLFAAWSIVARTKGLST